MPKIKELECSRCKATASAETPQTVCSKCAGSLYVRYDLTPMRGAACRAQISEKMAGGKSATLRASAGMWRYRSVLPEVEPVTLGEGWTPMLCSKRYSNVMVKEEGANPTGSFKARGLALA